MKIDERLIPLLRENARTSITELARHLGVSRATVQQAMERLERQGVIQGYTLRLGAEHLGRQVSAYVMISAEPKKTAAVIRQLHKHPHLDMLCTISGQYDLLARVSGENTEALDTTIDLIAGLDGVEKTLSHVVLSNKIDR